MSDVMAIGAKTPWGAVAAVMVTSGERYYLLRDVDGVVAMMPASTVEQAVPAPPRPLRPLPPQREG